MEPTSQLSDVNQDKQQTIKSSFSLSGISIHSGKDCTATFRPAKTNSGIYFIYQGKKFEALIKNLGSTQRETCIGEVKLVEHILAAAYGLGIDNLEIELSHFEAPILDGSAAPFLEAFKNTGIIEQEAKKSFLIISKILSVSEGDSSLEIRPYNGFKINFMVEFPMIGRQTLEYNGNFEAIAAARTFGYLSEFEALKAKNLALGASIENALVVGPNGYLNTPRYPDEPVRHKILDLIGDLALLGRPIKGEISAVKSGHKLNSELVKKLSAVC